MSLEEVKLLIGIDDNSQDELLKLIIRNVEQQLLGRLQEDEDTVIEVIPSTLDYIVTEVAVVRYNRLGSEGKTQESVEGFSSTYADSDFLGYETAIERYLNLIRIPKRGVLRFL
ncbi:MAG: phage head-tail connector protein [Staphylococcus equorum]|nr:phage head-tail connector protein [Staphylococcus equorum]